MKKGFTIFAVCLLSFLLVGCGCNKKENNDGNKVEKTQIEQTLEKFYTDDTKLVYDNAGIYKLVFYYKDNEITGLEHYYEYENESIAEAQYQKDKEDYKNIKSIRKITLSGKYVVYTLAGDQFEGKTVQEVKDSYSFLVPIYEN